MAVFNLEIFNYFGESRLDMPVELFRKEKLRKRSSERETPKEKLRKRRFFERKFALDKAN